MLVIIYCYYLHFNARHVEDEGGGYHRHDDIRINIKMVLMRS